MIRKKIIIALLSIFILSACGSNVETIQPTSISIPTSKSTSTFTPEPTATNTSIPTDTPFQYTSCADPKLIVEVVTDFETRNRMILDQAYELARKDPDFGDETTRLLGNPSNQIGVSLFYIGSRLVSGEGIPGGQVKNVLCAYGRLMIFNDNGSYSNTALPVGWEDMQGNFHKFVDGYDRASVSEEGDESSNSENQIRTAFDSLAGAQQFLNNMPDGARIKIRVRTFSVLSKVEDIVEPNDEVYGYTKNIQDFLRMLGQQWANRNFNQELNSIGLTLDRVSPEVGDPGLFPADFMYWDEGRLHPSE